MNQAVEFFLPVQALLRQAGIETSIKSISPANAGGNNRIYTVHSSTGLFAAKQYFRHAGDKRDRLESEYAFLEYASDVAPKCVPRPYAANPEAGWALYEYVEGQHILPGKVTGAYVGQASAFFQALNQPNSKPEQGAHYLPHASEACFTIADHLALVEERITQLKKAISESDQEASRFVVELADHWKELANAVRTAAALEGQLLRPLDETQRCISPSDFGFHNALMQPDGRIKFIDFEYAGVDDPAKMTGDFFAQLAVPVPTDYFEKFVTDAMQCFPSPADLCIRASWLRPVYQVKWCCIAMNVFLPVNLARRKFANPGLDEAQLKQIQLNKAIQLFQTFKQGMTNGIH